MADNAPLAAGAIPLRERRSLADEWKEFERKILDPVNAGKTQRSETRRAFYAGAATFFDLQTGGFDTDHDPTELDLQYISSLHEELREFARDIARGKA